MIVVILLQAAKTHSIVMAVKMATRARSATSVAVVNVRRVILTNAMTITPVLQMPAVPSPAVRIRQVITEHLAQPAVANAVKARV